MEICRSCSRHHDILSFLLRRGDAGLAKDLALQIVKERLQERPWYSPVNC